MNCYVYMIVGANRHFYTGVTSDPGKRLDQHNGLIRGGAKHTRANRPYTLIHIEKLPNRSEALKREYVIKQLTHAEKALLAKKTKKKDLKAYGATL